MNWIEKIAENKINTAIEDGSFSNLKNKGKPLHLDKDPTVDNDWALAHHILKENGFKPHWIQMMSEIDSAIEKARSQLHLKFELANTEMEKILACEQFNQEIRTINKRIFDYNLLVPVITFQRKLICVEEEFNQAKNRNQ